MIKIITALIIFLVTWPSFAADPNGYTAQYECRAGGPNCNVDIATYVSQACQQTITTGDSASTISNKINGGSQYICVSNGDYTGKGTITISASGNSGSRKALRYTRSGDNDDEPWNQSAGNQATLQRLVIDGDYWIIHRLRFDSASASSKEGIRIGGSNNILSRVEALNGGSNIVIESSGINTAQGFYSHNAELARGSDSNGVAMGGGGTPRLVNCEIRDIPSHAIYTWGGTSVENAVIENCDVYTSPSMYTDCNGNFTPGNPNSPCAASEGALSLKASTFSTNITKVIHNRFWGTRRTDTSVCCIDGTGGQIISLSDESNNEAKYVLFQNNIVMDGSVGIQHPHSTAQGADNHHNSIIGNLVYKVNVTMEFINGRNEEVYLNSFIQANKWGGFSTSNSDFKCNTLIDTGTRHESAGSGTEIDINVFYGVTPYTTGTNNVSITISTRANSTNYSTGAIIRPAALNNYLYRATKTGTTTGSQPTWCTDLGCTVVDGGVTWQAVRGPYTFYRKLRTAPEQYTIPYARVHSTAQEVNFCPPGYASRKGIGISD